MKFHRASDTTRRQIVRIAIVVPTLLVACKKSDVAAANGDDPIAALNSRAATTRYVHEFWIDQARRRTTLWDSALALCSAYWKRNDGSKPNCGHVYTANFQNAGANTPIRGKNMSVDSAGAR
jgi:hypothetical protein